MVEAQRALAGLALQKNDMAGMERAATQIISLQPAVTGWICVCARFRSWRGGSSLQAEQDARKAIEVAPQSPAGLSADGKPAHACKQNFPEAESWYKQSLSRDPESADALRGLVNVYLLMKQPDKAIAAVKAQIALSPKNSGFYDLLGAVMMGRKDFSGAQTALTQAIALDKNNADAYIKLCQAQSASGALDQAIATCNDGIRDNPKAAPNSIIQMGSVYEDKHDSGQGEGGLPTARCRIRRDDPTASNNLAYVMLETGGNADLALQLAQTARRALPESSNVADTLGWAFYQKGVYQSAIDLFQEAIKLAAKNKEPDNPLYHYHLGLAYAKADQPALARQHLERVLKLDPKYSDADDVRKQLAQLKS